jgi:hypothetical protein
MSEEFATHNILQHHMQEPLILKGTRKLYNKRMIQAGKNGLFREHVLNLRTRAVTFKENPTEQQKCVNMAPQNDFTKLQIPVVA